MNKRGGDARSAFLRRAVVDDEILRDVKDGGRVELPTDVAHYFTRVLRLRDGTRVTLLDGNGRLVDGTLRAGSASTIDDVSVGHARDPLPPLVVYQALVRATKIDEVAQRATEFGASDVVIFRSARSVVGDNQVKLERLEKIVKEATRQSLRMRSPRLAGVLAFAELLDELKRFHGALVFGALGANASAQSILAAHANFREHGMAVVIGPEGGLDDDEEEALVAAGAVPVALGVHVLRTETAGLAALAAAQGALGHL